MTSIQYNDVSVFAQTFELSESFKESKFLITGATGLIGSTLVRCLLALDYEDYILIDYFFHSVADIIHFPNP